LLHVGAYRARPDAAVVVHTHPTFCVVWSKENSVLPRDTVGARETLREVVLTRFHPAGSAALADEVAAVLRRGIDNVLLERHGFLAVSDSLEDAFLQTDLAEEAARIAYFSRLAGFTSSD
jgi:ribulose-5-phosphate 4-epimerase/fuculose-1-phosphate aldolase